MTLFFIMISIRKINSEEVILIHVLAHQIWNKVYPSIITQAQIDYMLEKMYAVAVLKNEIDNGVVFHIVEEDGLALGFCAFEQLSTHEFKLHKIYVQPETKGKKIGSLLLLSVENIIAENDNATLILNVNKYNSAKNFYEKKGFTVMGQGVFDIGNGFFMDDFIMTKTIPANTSHSIKKQMK